MKKKSLLQTNRYLKDLQNVEKLIVRAVLSSSRIEGINISADTILQSEKKTALNPSPDPEK